MRYMRAAAALVAAGLLLATGARAQVYSIGTNPQGSINFAQGTAIAKVMATKAGRQFRVAPYGGSSTYVPLVDRGEVEFGIANGGEVRFAYTGTVIFDKAFPNIRLVTVINPTLSVFIVRADSELRTVPDLKGNPVSSGYDAGRILQVVSDAIFASVGMTEKDYVGVPVPNLVESVEALIAGRADAAYMGLNAAAAQKAMASIKGGIRHVSLDPSPEAQARMTAVYPSSRPTAVRPAKENVGVELDPTYLFTIDFYLFASASVPDDVVYEVVKVMHDSKPEMAAVHPTLNDFEPARMHARHDNPYHPGALKYYREMGM